jgi:hypothetical protein
MAHPTAAEKGQIEELKKQNTALSTQLLDLEIQLVEQHEEFSKYVRARSEEVGRRNRVRERMEGERGSER